MTPAHPSRLAVRLVPAALSAVALTVSLIGPASAVPSAGGPTAAISAAAVTAVKKPPIPKGLPDGIEDLADYVPANSCSPTTRPGTKKLGSMLTTTYSNTTFGGARSCGSLPDSEHHDGRAVDWMNSIRNPTQANQAKTVISWLLATDADGNEYANARRLGVMYIIWNGKIWGAYSADRGWRPYSSCATHKEKAWDTTCHRDHMHLSLSWAGAMGRTSYWTGKVAAADYGRCRPADLNWAYVYKRANPNRCARVSTVSAPKGASSLLTSLTRYSGRPFVKGNTEAGVTAVQKAVGAKATGTFDSATVTAVKRWQSAHQLPATGGVSYATWRSILTAKAPK